MIYKYIINEKIRRYYIIFNSISRVDCVLVCPAVSSSVCCLTPRERRRPGGDTGLARLQENTLGKSETVRGDQSHHAEIRRRQRW